MKLIHLAPDEAAKWWPRLREQIADACTRSGGKYEAVDILRAALARRMQLWLAVDGSGRHHAVAVTEIVQYPRCSVCAVLACTGEDAADWAPLIQGIETWARERGCRTIEPRCRPGWEKLLKPHGYRRTHSILEKPLCSP